MRFCTVTLGCKVNQYETQAIERILRKHGHEIVKLGDGCDVCILNTCAVTAESERKSRQLISKLKKREPDALIAVCGCYSQLEPETVASLEADLVGGVYNRHEFVMSVTEKHNHRPPAFPAFNHPTFEELPPGNSASRTRALLKIQDGCNNFCTYCIVPYIRGRSRSLPLERLTEYAKQLEDQGYKEIVITGIEISSYGNDLRQGTPSIITAIQTIHNAAPTARLRLGSLDPAVLTKEFCQQLSRIPNLCNHFHLSLQSGCDDTLQRMGRKYNTAHVLESINHIRTNFTDCGITADLITGFPGETKDEFDKTLEFIKKAAFSDMHIFPYSLRPGTKAANMPGQTEKGVKKKRAQQAIEAAALMANDFKRTNIGKTVEVLFEQHKNGISTGHTSNYIEVAVKSKAARNTLQNVKITTLEKNILSGKIV